MTHDPTKSSVLSVGRLYCDFIFTDVPRLPSLGTEVFAEGFGLHPGGGAFITSAHLADLGHPSSLAAMLPAPPFDDLIAGEIAGSGVDLALCQRLPNGSGPQITVAMAQGGDRAFLTRRAGPAFPKLSARLLEGRAFRHLHIGELASLVAEPGIVALARSQGMSVSADCGWDDDLRADTLRPLAGLVDVFLPNADEYAALRDIGLADGFAPVIAVKRGPAGATAHSAEGTVEAPTNPVRAVDTTGAGDAFNAGFLSEWLAGAALPECLDAGNSRGAICVRQSGGFSQGSVVADLAGAPGE
ncbi:MAG: PfkB family carbohydrate kinase [Pseudomonadota bacterium]